MSGTAQASESDADPTSDIIVTATRRAEKVGDIPISITALGESFLKDSASRNMADVVKAVPGLSLTPTASGTQIFSIRGANTSSGQSNLQSPVALYLDDVPVLDPFVPWGVPRLQLFDIDRVEVLRGPQGTLFGAGALGGAIRFITNKPNTRVVQAAAESTLKSRAGGALGYSENGMINLPIVDEKLALRVVGFYDHEGGWVDNIRRGDKDANSGNVYGGRAQIMWEPIDRLSLIGTVSIEVSRPRDSEYTPYESSGYIANSYLPQYTRNNTKIYNLNAEYKLSGATLTSVTSLLDRKSRQQLDFTNRAIAIVGLNVPSPLNDFFDSRNFVQEVRLASTSGGPFQWVIGGLIQRYDLRALETVSQSGAGAVFASIGYPSDILQDTTTRAKVNENAVFGEITYSPIDALSFTAGARAFRQSISTSVSSPDTFFEGPDNRFSTAAKYKKITPKFVVAYKPKSDILIYAQASEGYRAGQGNLAPATDPVSGETIPKAYGPDQLWNYELGFKGSFLDRRLVLNAAAFYIDWSRIQLLQRTSGLGLAVHPLMLGPPASMVPKWKSLPR